MSKRPRGKRRTRPELDEGILDYGPLSTIASLWSSGLSPEFMDLLDQIDQKKEPRLLLPRILSSFSPEEQRHIKNLFERNEFKSRSRKTPSYRPSYDDMELLNAVLVVKNYGWTVTDAVRFLGVKRSPLFKALTGKHSSLRRGIKLKR